MFLRDLSLWFSSIDVYLDQSIPGVEDDFWLLIFCSDPLSSDWISMIVKTHQFSLPAPLPHRSAWEFIMEIGEVSPGENLCVLGLLSGFDKDNGNIFVRGFQDSDVAFLLLNTVFAIQIPDGDILMPFKMVKQAGSDQNIISFIHQFLSHRISSPIHHQIQIPPFKYYQRSEIANREIPLPFSVFISFEYDFCWLFICSHNRNGIENWLFVKFTVAGESLNTGHGGSFLFPLCLQCFFVQYSSLSSTIVGGKTYILKHPPFFILFCFLFK